MADSQTTGIKPTKRMLEFLRWVDSVESYSMWPIAASVMQRKASALGLVEKRGREPGMIGFTRWHLSNRGREALKSA